MIISQEKSHIQNIHRKVANQCFQIYEKSYNYDNLIKFHPFLTFYWL